MGTTAPCVGKTGRLRGLCVWGAGLMEEDAAEVTLGHKTKTGAFMNDFRHVSCHNSNRYFQNHRDVEMTMLPPPSVNAVENN